MKDKETKEQINNELNEMIEQIKISENPYWYIWNVLTEKQRDENLKFGDWISENYNGVQFDVEQIIEQYHNLTGISKSDINRYFYLIFVTCRNDND